LFLDYNSQICYHCYHRCTCWKLYLLWLGHTDCFATLQNPLCGPACSRPPFCCGSNRFLAVLISRARATNYLNRKGLNNWLEVLCDFRTRNPSAMITLTRKIQAFKD